MIPKRLALDVTGSAQRFSDKIMRKQEGATGPDT